MAYYGIGGYVEYQLSSTVLLHRVM